MLGELCIAVVFTPTDKGHVVLMPCLPAFSARQPARQALGMVQHQVNQALLKRTLDQDISRHIKSPIQVEVIVTNVL